MTEDNQELNVLYQLLRKLVIQTFVEFSFHLVVELILKVRFQFIS